MTSKNLVRPFDRIVNYARGQLQSDFGFSAISYLTLGLTLALGLAVQWYFYSDALTPGELAGIAAGALVAGSVLWTFPMWLVVVQLEVIGWIVVPLVVGPEAWPLLTAVSAGLVLAASVQLVQHWDKVVILRFGRFRKDRGPGLFFVMPFIDRIAAFVDTRIRATDFSAEKSLTRDTVPVHVDALTFWMIWDPKRAVLEVENYVEAVILSAQTALRDAIGRHDLSELLSERERLAREIQKVLDAKTNPWGITILSIEFTDVIIPQELENAMSKRAQAEREGQSRVILGAAEVEVAEKIAAAARVYGNDPSALHLRGMSMVHDGLKAGGSIMVMPAGALDSMNLGATMGATAFARTEQAKTGMGTSATTGQSESGHRTSDAAARAAPDSPRGRQADDQPPEENQP